MPMTPKSVPEETEPGSKTNKMILIVEDDQVLLRVLYLFL